MRRSWLILLFAALAAGGPADTPVRGVVLDPGGRPLAGATVTLFGADGGCLLVPGCSFARVETGGNGEFRLPATPAPMEILVEHPDHAPARAPAGPGVVVRLRSGAFIEGTVSAPAHVRAAAGLRLLAAVEANGTFRLGPLPPGETITVTALSGSHRPFQRRLTIDDGATVRLDIGLDEGLALRGKVLPAEADVVLRASQGESRESVATTAEDGTFALTGLAPGEVCVVVLAPGREPRIVTGVAGDHVDVRLDR